MRGGKLRLASDAPRTLFIFKLFINFSSKMTKRPGVYRLNVKNASHLEGCITGRARGSENNFISTYSSVNISICVFFLSDWCGVGSDFQHLS